MVPLRNESVKSDGDLMTPVEWVSAGPSGYTSHSQSFSQQEQEFWFSFCLCSRMKMNHPPSSYLKNWSLIKGRCRTSAALIKEPMWEMQSNPIVKNEMLPLDFTHHRQVVPKSCPLFASGHVLWLNVAV